LELVKIAHYAFIDENNVVVEVIPGRDEWEIVDGITDWEAYYTTKREGLRAVRTSYNTVGGTHTTGAVPFRGNYAGIGYTYDEELDAFIPPKPFESWVLNEETFNWVAPVPYPEGEIEYTWDESSASWVEITVE
jgi:hypothetical protein